MMKPFSFAFLIGLFFLAACRQEEDIDLPRPAEEEVGATLQFQLAAPPTTRTPDLRWEESDVHDLLYAVFQGSLLREMKEVWLTSDDLRDHRYTVTVPKKWLDGTTEIYAVANVPQKLKDDLRTSPYAIPDDDPLLARLVSEQLDSLARAEVATAVYAAQYTQEPFPKDKKIHRLPAHSSNYEERYLDLPPAYRCATYADFVKRCEEADLPMEVRTTYERMAVDLQCRLVNYRSSDVEKALERLTRQEETDHALRKAWQANGALQRYLCWRNMEWEADLNAEAAACLSKGIERPLMAGRRALMDDFPTVIVVPMERTYSRIWFNFEWDAHKEADAITVDAITVRGLMKRTRLFNLSLNPVENNPSSLVAAELTLRDTQPDDAKSLRPFFADLNRPAFPYHWGEKPQMELDVRYPAYHTLAVYPQTAGGEIDKTQPAHRCYVYSFQRGGRSLVHNPEIEVAYHFYRQLPGEPPVRIDKRAVARLYDEVHQPGKRHHGLLRNYTYQLNCKVTTLNHLLQLQVVSVPWYAFSIDDIPTFE